MVGGMEVIASLPSSNAESPFSSILPYFYRIDWLCNINKEGQTGMQKTEANIKLISPIFCYSCKIIIKLQRCCEVPGWKELLA
jgi:hypothetical protein